MKGPKPKPPGLCAECGKYALVRTREWCTTCYVRLLRNGLIQKIPVKEMPDTLTPTQQEVLTGLMLGDGCLYRRKPTHTPYLSITRQLQDLDYLEWTADLFRDFMKRPVKTGEVYDERTGKTYQNAILVTRRASIFRDYYEKWYPNGVKVVPQDLEFTPLILAVWFLDDGCNHPSCSPWRMKLKLSTEGFTDSDVHRLQHMLEERYGYHFSFSHKGDSGFLTSADAGTRAFLNEIDAVMPPGMGRKLCWRQTDARFYVDIPKTHLGWAHRRPK